MNQGIRGFLIVGFALLLAPVANAAPIIVGTYTGTWQQSAILGTVTMTIDEQTLVVGDTYEIDGVFDWLCVTGSTCSGQEFFSGTLTGNNLSVAGFALQNPVNILLAFYTATVSADGLVIDGTFSPTADGVIAGTFTVSTVPEPSTLFLLASGTVGLIAYRRRLRSRSAD